MPLPPHRGIPRVVGRSRRRARRAARDPARVVLVQRRERHRGARPGRDGVGERLLDPGVRHAQDREVDGLGDVGDGG